MGVAVEAEQQENTEADEDVWPEVREELHEGWQRPVEGEVCAVVVVEDPNVVEVYAVAVEDGEQQDSCRSAGVELGELNFGIFVAGEGDWATLVSVAVE